MALLTETERLIVHYNPAKYGELPMTFAQDKREYDSNGWFEVEDNPISKAGVFPYRGRNIVLPDGSTPPDPDEMYGVFRPPEELSDPEAINSFKLIPWVDNHAMLGSEELGMTPAEKKGVGGTTGEKVYYKDGTLFSNIKTYSEALANAINNGKKELSLGYRCVYEYAPGVYKGVPYQYVQRKIRGNHLALVDEGRMGADVRVMDGKDCAGKFTFSCDSMEKKMAEMTPGEKPEKPASLAELVAQLKALTVAVAELKQAEALEGEQQADTGDADPDAPADQQVPADPEVPADAPTEDDGEPEGLDKVLDMCEQIFDRIESLDARLSKIEGGAASTDGDDGAADPADKKAAAATSMDAADVQRAVMQRLAARDKAYQAVSRLVGAFDCSAMDEADVYSYGCKKSGLKASGASAKALFTGYAAGRGADQAKKARSAVAQDASDGDDFITKQFKKGA